MPNPESRAPYVADLLPPWLEPGGEQIRKLAFAELIGPAGISLRSAEVAAPTPRPGEPRPRAAGSSAVGATRGAAPVAAHEKAAPGLRGGPARRSARPGGRGAISNSGDNRPSRRGHYHGPGGLNGRARDGNGCDPAGIVAGRIGRPAVKPHRSLLLFGFGGSSHPGCGAWHASPRSVAHPSGDRQRSSRRPTPSRPPLARRPRIGVAELSAVGAGPLRRSPAVHAQPIDLVVFQEPCGPIGPRKPRLKFPTPEGSGIPGSGCTRCADESFRPPVRFRPTEPRPALILSDRGFSKRLAADLDVGDLTGPTVRGPNRRSPPIVKELGVPLELVPFVRDLT
jgi:hypothetical protein